MSCVTKTRRKHVRVELLTIFAVQNKGNQTAVFFAHDPVLLDTEYRQIATLLAFFQDIIADEHEGILSPANDALQNKSAGIPAADITRHPVRSRKYAPIS